MDVVHKMIQLQNIEGGSICQERSRDGEELNSKSLDSATVEPWKLKKIYSKGNPISHTQESFLAHFQP